MKIEKFAFKRGDRVEHPEWGPHATIAQLGNRLVMVWDDGRIGELNEEARKLIKLKGLGRKQKT